jgi:hypothetical protein
LTSVAQIQTEALGKSETLEWTIERFRKDFPAYAALLLRIRDKAARNVPLNLNRSQQIVHEAISEQKKKTGRIRAVVLKARQEGVSTLTAGRFFRGIHLFAGRKAMIVADTLERASGLFTIYQRFLENLPEELLPQRKTFSRERRITFTHDSELSVRPASDTEAGRSLTLHYLHASELAFWPANDSRETWTSLLQAVPDTGSEIIVESTAKGAGGIFHELWEASQQPGSGWLGIFLPWWIHEEYEIPNPPDDVLHLIATDPDDFEKQSLTEGLPYNGEYHRLSLGKLAWRRMKIVESFGGDPTKLSKDAVRQFQQEFPATAEEAFLVSGACFFDEDELRAMARNVKEPLVRGRLVKRDDGSVGIDSNVRGFLRIFEPPIPVDDKNVRDYHYVIGADTATGKLVSERPPVGGEAEAELGGRDYSCAVVVRLPFSRTEEDGKTRYYPPKQVAELHGHAAPEVFAEQLNLLGRYYACGDGKHDRRTNAVEAVETNHSSGQSIIRLLREHFKYTPLYWQKEINKRTRMVKRSPGWRTDETNRMIMLDSVAEMIRKGDFELPSKDLIREMVTFVVWPDGKPMAEENCHDDRVIALCLAVQMFAQHRHIRAQLPTPVTPQPTQTGL